MLPENNYKNKIEHVRAKASFDVKDTLIIQCECIVNIKLPGHSHREMIGILLKTGDNIGFARRFVVRNIRKLIKPFTGDSFLLVFAVAPYEGAWIEINAYTRGT